MAEEKQKKTPTKKSTTKKTISQQKKEYVNKKTEKEDSIFKPPEGNAETMTSTGSTLLDLAIAGGRVRGGGLTGGIFVEVLGPSSSGKSVLLSEILGNVERKGGDPHYGDPEGRWDKKFAELFIDNINKVKYSQPKRVPEAFKEILHTKSENNNNVVDGWAIDSLAALSTDLEMDNEEGDKLGMRRAKEFSEWLRKVCLHIVDNNYLVVASNQVRQTGNQFGPKYESPGGEAIGFYASVRLKLNNAQKIIREKTIEGKKEKRVVGIQTNVEVLKNSTWQSYRSAPVYIYYSYGIDDIRANLQFIKDHSKSNVYTLKGQELGKEMNAAIAAVEEDELEEQLKEEVIDLWEEIERKLSEFESNRKKKKR